MQCWRGPNLPWLITNDYVRNCHLCCKHSHKWQMHATNLSNYDGYIWSSSALAGQIHPQLKMDMLCLGFHQLLLLLCSVPGLWLFLAISPLLISNFNPGLAQTKCELCVTISGESSDPLVGIYRWQYYYLHPLYIEEGLIEGFEDIKYDTW